MKRGCERREKSEPLRVQYTFTYVETGDDYEGREERKHENPPEF